MKKAADQEDKLEKLYNKCGGKCKYLIDHGVAIEHVEIMNKQRVEKDFIRISKKIQSESSPKKKKSRLITLAEKEELKLKSNWEDEQIKLFGTLMETRGEEVK